MMNLPTIQDIYKAAERISPFAKVTPVLTCEAINKQLNGYFYFKCENFQKVGAFKFRGACNAVFSLSKEELAKGVGTHSSGNHAAALTLAAKFAGTHAHIVMPNNAPNVKKLAVAEYGGNITYCEPTLEARETTLQSIVDEIGVSVIHPYDNFHVIAGQGTAAKELLESHTDLDIIMAPVGGGGLLSGTALAAKSIKPDIKVIAVEPQEADDAYRSFKAGHIIPSINPTTIADGLLTSLGERNFALIQNNVDDILTVSEESIIQAMKLVWERMKIIIEPSSAVPLAAFLEGKIQANGRSIGIILTGGNVDLSSNIFT